MQGYINSFESFGTKDGPGIRFVVFMQGCPLRCLYCHNVDTWELKDKNYIYTPNEILAELNKVKAFLTGGITASGGEPLMQASFILELFKLCKENGIHTALDTSGFIFNDQAKKVLEYTDLVLLDIKHIDKDMYKKLTSVDLEPTLNFIKYLQEINKPVWLRYVLLPGYTDDIKDLNDWAKYVSQFDVVKRVDILPFHQMAIYKWEKTNRDYKLKDVSAPTKEQIHKAEEIFKKYDLPLYKERS